MPSYYELQQHNLTKLKGVKIHPGSRARRHKVQYDAFEVVSLDNTQWLQKHEIPWVGLKGFCVGTRTSDETMMIFFPLSQEAGIAAVFSFHDLKRLK